MIKFFCVLLFGLSISVSASINKEQLNKLNVGALLVKDMTSNQMLYAKEAFKELKPASLTKVMTALIAIEQGDLNRPVTITYEMIQVEPTIAGYKPGDVIRLRDLVTAAMVKSDNDAAKSIAIAVGGTEKRFVEMMNAKAKALGMKHTHFVNPCGFDNKEHYSTPSDLLKMTEYAIKNKYFNEISKKNQHTYFSLNNNKKFLAYTHNRLLSRYEYAVGVKTGYTSKAGACLIARAKKNGRDCLIVMMDSKEDRWKTAKQIFEQVFVSKSHKNG
ncbi:MAG: serine hydrolase [Sulfurimonas sp.]|uniref:D-alanyl-D-alanine carboxypeptidase family protein n=1 Tax=Sulfurimonas sp. TaxID=2022749 RepID=UPI002630570A|nr:serine hydrolase [Sulfurimonas sp.]MDD5373904.1 serine hydrolase [Sulfurimonas sp.]